MISHSLPSVVELPCTCFGVVRYRGVSQSVVSHAVIVCPHITRFSCVLQPPPSLVTIKKWAIASAVFYVVGIPATYAFILFKHRESIVADQQLRVKGQGNSRRLNPHFPTRQRYQRLYRCTPPPLRVHSSCYSPALSPSIMVFSSFLLSSFAQFVNVSCSLR